ncbi:MmcQ/YjbR family DNA-binding protein [Nocardia arthritidis]|uniref:MmcQ/YjbR family DNA-binding protein n=1 Tax=Nocardia arthritidis TaxID=228602 RepID=A0A6G9YKF5_9NOCA|nr:MmcQ/YjbR family DNA-binding protein [Nocardia arthritidis]QIS13516.1 MmcQ/YjbR family DNA-binding protein [Nocardia arthritidis]
MDPLTRIREICLALPESSERLSHGVPTFFVRTKTTFTMFTGGHYDEPGPTIWCPAPPGVQADLIDAEPERFYRPPYVGHRGWLGIRLDVDPDWVELAAIVRDAYRVVAPKKLAALLD